LTHGIFTLCLHDALPIYEEAGHLRALGVNRQDCPPRTPLRRPVTCAPGPTASGFDCSPVGHVLAPAPRGPRTRAGENDASLVSADRKSTRLHSSHVKISY